MPKNPDFLIKIWGSLMWQDPIITDLVWAIEQESGEKRIVITTGSKDLSNVIRQYVGDNLPHRISESTHIDITMQARDMMARAFSHASTKFVPVSSVGEVNDALYEWRIPVLLQYDLLKNLKPFPLERWLSTDTTSAYFADLLKVKKFVKLTNVDGVYENIWDSDSLYSTVSTADLRRLWKTCIDVKLPDLLDRIKMRCYVMSGKKIPNLQKFLQYWSGVHTCVEPHN